MKKIALTTEEQFTQKQIELAVAEIDQIISMLPTEDELVQALFQMYSEEVQKQINQIASPSEEEQ